MLVSKIVIKSPVGWSRRELKRTILLLIIPFVWIMKGKPTYNYANYRQTFNYTLLYLWAEIVQADLVMGRY